MEESSSDTGESKMEFKCLVSFFNEENLKIKTVKEESEITFKCLGVLHVLCEACEELKWKTPTAIQREAIPPALQGKDIIGLAETGSGKTAAFAIPVLQALLEIKQRLFALVLTPTRELAFQVSEQFDALGAAIGVKTVVIVGGIDMATQRLALSEKPHIIIATPGRLIDHLENTKGFSLRALKYLIVDEADRILDKDFEQAIDKLLKAIPEDRHTYLYSATMTEKVQKLERASLKNPVMVKVSKKYQTVENLVQCMMYLPDEDRYKYLYLVHVLVELLQNLHCNSIMVFCETCENTQRTAFLLRNLGLPAIPLYGKLSQAQRLGALQKFKAKTQSILIATNVASRGLDIPHVDVVINFDVPSQPKDYTHRVGRTARAGCNGKAITFVTPKTLFEFREIEERLGKKLKKYDPEKEDVFPLLDRVTEAKLIADREIKQDRKELENKDKKRKYEMAAKNDLQEFKNVKKKFKKKNYHK